MNTAQFDATAPGDLVEIVGGHAFLPNRLPPDVAVSRRLLNAAEEARGAISLLVGKAALVSNLELIMRPLARREAVLSSRIEGTQTQILELLLEEASPSDGGTAQDADRGEVLNYLHALEFGHEWLAEGRPLGVSLIKQLHHVLLSGVRGGEKHLGEFRRSNVFIGSRGLGMEGARFVPPPAEHVQPLIANWVEFAVQDVEYGSLIDSAILHYQFETIHPFEDGNGRIGRLLIPLFLVHRGVLERPFLYVSAYFEARRDEYMDHLLGVSTRGRWEEWFFFFLAAVRAQADDARSRVDLVMTLHEQYRQRVAERSASRAALLAIDVVMERVIVSIPQIAEGAHTTYPTARAAAESLVELGILAAYERIRGTQYWIARELLEAVYESDQPTRPQPR